MAEWNISKEKSSGIVAEQEYCILVGLVTKDQTLEQVEEYLDELQFLAMTAGALTKKRVIQKLPHPDKRTFVGKGKLEEIKEILEFYEDINLVIFDDDLTGKQTNILEEYLKEIGRAHV